jgi:hypothetical protein
MKYATLWVAMVQITTVKTRRISRHPLRLHRDHPTAVAFLDESGTISHDRFFAVGCLKLAEPSVLLRAVQKLRDKYHWYDEIHWVDLTRDALPFYTDVAALIAASDAQFSCFVADRSAADPVTRFKTPWRAYEKLAVQLLLGNIRHPELVSVLADNYSTPDDVVFERDVRSEVNWRLKRLAVTSVCRLDSKSTDPLQLVDLLTSGISFEFRQAAGLAGKRSPKARLASDIRRFYGIESALNGVRMPKLNVAVYRDQGQ